MPLRSWILSCRSTLIAGLAATAGLAGLAPGGDASASATTGPSGGAGLGAGPCPDRSAATGPTRRDVRFSFGGLTRSAYVVDPGGVEPAPVVIALHGWGGDGRRMAGYSGLAQLAGQADFVAVFPSAHGVSWNIAASRRAPDDVGFLKTLIARMVAADCGDPARVFVTGVSNGAGMAALAGCRLAGIVRAIAPVAGDYAPLPPCRPGRPLSMLEIHGTADPSAPYLGRRVRRTADGLPGFVGTLVAREGCAPRPARSAFAARTTRYRFAGCRGGAMIEHLRIAGGRHQWPGATPPDPGPATTFSAAGAIWSFFASLGG